MEHKKFYEVDLDSGDRYYFQDKLNAREYLWDTYIDEIGVYEDENQNKAAYEELIIDGRITGVGYIWAYEFED